MVQLLATPLLSSKLAPPPLRAGLVLRPQLTRRIAEGLRRKLLLVVAPPAFGKTTLLAEALHTKGERIATPQFAASADRASNTSPLPAVAWLSLDERDNDPTRFFSYVIAALDRIAPGVGDHALSMLRSPTPAPMEVVLGALLEELGQLPSEFVLVLDDYHLMSDRVIHKGMAFVLKHMPPQSHLVLLTRSEPPLLPLARLRLRDELVELRAPDLRFSREESADYLNRLMGLGLTPAEVAALEARTEGWVGALGLAALSLREHASPQAFIAGFRGSHRHVVDYLADEVLRRQPPEVQAFLLHTAVLDQLCGELCDHLIADCKLQIGDLSGSGSDGQSTISNLQSAIMLEQLEQAGLFLIPLDPQRRWYRYHTLFAEFLRERLAYSAPDLIPVLHRRAADWYAGRGLPIEAVGHLLAARDLDAATLLIERTARPLLLRSEVSTVLGWLRAMPPDELRARPLLCVVMAWALAVAGQFDAVEPYLQVAEAAIGAEDDLADERLALYAPYTRRNFLSEVLAVRATVAGLRRDVPRTIALAREALALLPDDSVLVRAVVALMLGTATYLSGNMAAAGAAFAQAIEAGRAGDLLIITLFAMRQLGELQMRTGQLHRAAATFQRAIDLAAEYYPAYTGAQAGRPIPVAGTAYVGMGLVQYEWNNLEVAARLLADGIKLGQQGSNLEILLMGPIGLARVELASGKHATARGTIGEAFDYARRTGVARLADWLGAEQARLDLLAGDPRAALAWDRERGLGLDDQLSYMLEIDYLTLAQTRMAQDRPAEALRLLERMQALAEAEGRQSSVIEILALRAIALSSTGEPAAARKALRRALDIAAPEGYVRSFIDLGPPLADLLGRELQAIEGEGRGGSPFATYVRSLLACFPAQADALTAQGPLVIAELVESISAREQEVLRLVAAGLSNQEIADRLIIGLSTVKKHINNIYGKLEVKSRTQALRRARELGIL